MKRKAANTSLTFAIAFLLVCMALPTMAKLAHAIHGHKERACCENTRIHYHSGGYDCLFQKFKNIAPYYSPQVSYSIQTPREDSFLPQKEYDSISQIYALSLSLRAPPLFS